MPPREDPVSETPPQPSGKVARVLRALTLLAALAAVGGAVALTAFWMSFKAQRRATEVHVPELRGLSQVEAEARAGRAGVVLEVVEERHDPATSRGQVLGQEPGAGASVRRGRKVRVVLSLGGEVLQVPQLVGEGARTVALRLEQAGFALGDEARFWSRGVPAGTVLAQSPAAGSPGVPGTRVHRLVSGGPPPTRWVMPDLTGLERARVESWITASGFRLAPVRRVAGPGAPGTVVGQLPLPGHPVGSRAVVQLTVASGGL
jgi:beta-lactam-binding protein with PASTA domain